MRLPKVNRRLNYYASKGWITIGAVNHHGGTPVELDETGEIKKGPSGLKGKKITELKKSKVKKSPFKKEKESFGPKNVFIQWDNKNDKKVAESFFGKNLDDSILGAIANTTDNGKVRIRVLNENHVEISTEPESNNGVKSLRKFYKRDGKLICKNHFLSIKNSSPYKGSGYKLFAAQVQALKELGVSKITTDAHIGTESAGLLNGYYTWPRMGYDGKLSFSIWKKIPEKIRDQLPKSDSPFGKILDLYDVTGGKEWWLNNGESIYDATFDLSDDSRSMKVLNAYIKEREERG